jgi:2-C-methyl-D-erythritol 4-phosphate cytidylyltransferase
MVDLAAIVPLPITVADNKAAVFTPLAGESPLIRIVRMMLGAVSEPSGVVVATAKPLADDVRESLAAHGLSSIGVTVAPGSGRRAQCLLTGLEYLRSEGVSARHILVHDIRRPLASAGLRDRVIAALHEGSTAVMPTLPLTDSVKVVDARGSVTGTLDRSTLRSVQYPRGFAADQFAHLLTDRTSDEFDELQEAMRAGVPITVVEGDPDAFVAELPSDAPFVEAIIASRRPDPH